MSYIYFALAEAVDLVKIGRTTKPPEARLRSLSTSSPHKLRLVGLIPEGSSGYTESSLHLKFSHIRENGEWFRYTEELKAFIDSPLATAVSFVRSSSEIAASVRQHRVAGGWTQADLAKDLGISRKWLMDLERGRKGLSFDMIMDVVNFLGISLAILPKPEINPTSFERMQTAAEMSKL